LNQAAIFYAMFLNHFTKVKRAKVIPDTRWENMSSPHLSAQLLLHFHESVDNQPNLHMKSYSFETRIYYKKLFVIINIGVVI
jgi:hypothetical protein